jgi:hypothetical protein
MRHRAPSLASTSAAPPRARQSERGGAALWAVMILGIVGVLSAVIVTKAGVLVRQVRSADQRDIGERALASALSLTAGLFRGGACATGSETGCAFLHPVRYTCHDGPKTGFAKDWWAWFEASGTPVSDDDLLVIGRALPRGGPWGMDVTQKPWLVRAYLPYMARSATPDDVAKAFRDGLKSGLEAPEANPAAAPASDCYAMIVNQFSARLLDADALFAGVDACRAKYTVTPTDPETRDLGKTIQTTVKLLGPACSAGRLVGYKVRASIDALPTATSQNGVLQSAASTMIAKATVNIPASSKRPSCRMVGPDAVHDGNPAALAVTVDGPASGLVVGFAGSTTFFARTANDAPEIGWSGNVVVNFGGAKTQTYAAQVYDEYLQPAGSCTFTVANVDDPIDPPSCTITIERRGKCAYGFVTPAGDFDSYKADSLFKCCPAKGEDIHLSGTITGPGGEASCQGDLVVGPTEEWCPPPPPPPPPGSGGATRNEWVQPVDEQPDAAVVAQAASALPPAAEVVTTVTIQSTTYGHDEEGRAYKRERVRETTGSSTRDYDVITYI